MFSQAMNKVAYLRRDIDLGISRRIKRVKHAYKGYTQLNEAKRICKYFANYFAPVVATGFEQNNAAHKIRHDVFCKELGLFDMQASNFESDCFDAYTQQLLIKHISSNQYSGTVRMITPSSDDQALPIEIIAREHITRKEFLPENFNREEICEISRIAIPSEFRRRRIDKFEGAAQAGINIEEYSEIELRCFPLIAVGLYMSCAAYAVNRGIKHAFFMVEPRLAKSMKFIGIKFEQIGPEFEYVGTRAPFYINYEDFSANLSPSFKHMMNEFTKKMS